MKRIITFGVLVLASATIYAQSENKTLGVPSKDGGQTVYYELLYDKPEDLKMMSLSLPLWNLSASKINTSIYDLNLGALYNDSRFQGVVKYKIGLGDKIAPDSHEFGSSSNIPLMFSIYEVPKSQEFSTTLTHIFKSTRVAGTETVKLKQVGKVMTVTEIPATILKNVGVNVGYAQGFTWYNMNNNKMTAVLRNGEEKQYELGSMSTVQTYKFLKVGLTFTKTVNIGAKFEGFGEKESSSYVTTWVNLIGALQNKFDDVFVPSYADDGSNGMSITQGLLRASIDGSNKKLPVGVEFGQRFMDKTSFFSFEYGVKYLPGFMNNINFLVDFGVNVNINFLRKN